MRRRLVVVGLLMIAAGARAEHLVAPEVAEARLTEAALARERNLSALERLPRSSEAESAAEAWSGNASAMRAALAGLTDQEIADLAARAGALEADPAGGFSARTDKQVAILFTVIIVLIVVLTTKPGWE